MVEYCNRPADFSELTLKNCAAILKPGDWLFHLGDFCMGQDERWHAVFMNALPEVRKVLIRGNHDKKSDKWYREHGWNDVTDSFELITLSASVSAGVLLSHEPRCIHLRRGLINIHGHFHNHLKRLGQKKWVVPEEEERNRENLEVLTNRHRLFSLEFQDYKPLALDRAMDLPISKDLLNLSTLDKC